MKKFPVCFFHVTAAVSDTIRVLHIYMTVKVKPSLILLKDRPGGADREARPRGGAAGALYVTARPPGGATARVWLVVLVAPSSLLPLKRGTAMTRV